MAQLSVALRIPYSDPTATNERCFGAILSANFCTAKIKSQNFGSPTRSLPCLMVEYLHWKLCNTCTVQDIVASKFLLEMSTCKWRCRIKLNNEKWYFSRISEDQYLSLQTSGTH